MKIIFTMMVSVVSLNVFSLNTLKKTTVTVATKNNYLISANLYLNDKKLNSAAFKVTEGEKGSIEMKENFIDLTSIASDQSQTQDGIKMSFAVGRFNEKGEKTIVASPTVVTAENKMTTLVFTENSGEDTYKLEMTPTKLTK